MSRFFVSLWAAALSALIVGGFASAVHAKPVLVRTNMDYPQGAIVIVNNERKLYYMMGNGKAMRYPVAVGNRQEIWTGKHVVTMKRKNPTWTSPDTGRSAP
ncbi:MAG: L,D-transpeptidase [Pseudomonadota bacterium]